MEILNRKEENMTNLSFSEFIEMLDTKSNGRKFKSKRWMNYPKSIFYYWEDDEQMQNEIAIYTCETAWGIYI